MGNSRARDFTIHNREPSGIQGCGLIHRAIGTLSRLRLASSVRTQAKTGDRSKPLFAQADGSSVPGRCALCEILRFSTEEDTQAARVRLAAACGISRGSIGSPFRNRDFGQLPNKYKMGRNTHYEKRAKNPRKHGVFERLATTRRATTKPKMAETGVIMFQTGFRWSEGEAKVSRSGYGLDHRQDADDLCIRGSMRVSGQGRGRFRRTRLAESALQRHNDREHSFVIDHQEPLP